MQYPENLVLKVNEFYHNVLGKEYDKKHFLAFEVEFNRWKNVGINYISKRNEKIKVLDIGTGTGFVPLVIGRYLKSEDIFICSDISANMLDICRRKVSKKKFNCHFDYIKLDGQKIDLESNQFDFITLNSVLHHIPDIFPFFREVNRLLKIGGILIMGHEPNKNFVRNRFLFNNYRLTSLIFQRKRIIPTILRKLGLKSLSEKLNLKFKTQDTSYDMIIDKTNDELIKNHVIEKRLSMTQICEIIDIHSPTAAGYHLDRGIDMSTMLTKHLKNFKIEHLDIYHHLGKASTINRFTIWYDSILKKIFKEQGSTFFIILKKIKNS